MAATESDLRRLLSEVAATRHYGFQLQAFSDGECTLLVNGRVGSWADRYLVNAVHGRKKFFVTHRC
jgi:hypothetical protein